MFGAETLLGSFDLGPVIDALRDAENWKAFGIAIGSGIIRALPVLLAYLIGPAVIIAFFGLVVRRILGGMAQAQLVYFDPKHPDLGIMQVPLVQGGAKDYLGRDRKTLSIIKAVIKSNRKSGRALLSFTPTQWAFVREKLKEKLLGLLKERFWDHAHGKSDVQFGLTHLGVRYNADDRREKRLQLIVVPDRTIQHVSCDCGDASQCNDGSWERVKEAVRGTENEQWIAVLEQIAEEAARNADKSTPESTAVASRPLPV